MSNIRDITDEQLWQYLRDAEAEVARLQAEVARRNREKHPELSEAVGKALMSAMDTPSMMQRNRL